MELFIPEIWDSGHFRSRSCQFVCDCWNITKIVHDFREPQENIGHKARLVYILKQNRRIIIVKRTKERKKSDLLCFQVTKGVKYPNCLQSLQNRNFFHVDIYRC